MPSATSHHIDDYESLLVALQNVLGVVVPESQRSCLVERVEPLLSSYKLESFSSLAQHLQDEKAEDLKSSVLEAISQRHSGWGLKTATLDVLRNYVFEQLPDKAKVLVVGGSYGQLGYAIAMELAEYENRSGSKKQASLHVIDSSESGIEYAEKAKYSSQELMGLSEEYKNLYTTAVGNDDSYRVIKDKIRQRVSFSQFDLTESFQSVGPVDVIICSEILVYFSSGVKAGILQQFSTLLKAGGIFVTDSHQTVNPLMKDFERVNHSSGIFYRKKQ